jgi:hypothetical protein
MVVATPGRGIAMQYRGTTGGVSAQVNVVPGGPDAWVRLTRDGNTFIGFWSSDGVSWRGFGSITIPMADRYLAGLPVTSHDNSTTTTATFEDVTFTNTN